MSYYRGQSSEQVLVLGNEIPLNLTIPLVTCGKNCVGFDLSVHTCSGHFLFPLTVFDFGATKQTSCLFVIICQGIRMHD